MVKEPFAPPQITLTVNIVAIPVFAIAVVWHWFMIGLPMIKLIQSVTSQ